MSRITGSEVANMMEAYAAIYSPNASENLWEEAGYLTEEFILESYQTVADYLVNNGIVPGYNTAEVFMSEMALEDIDSILFETGILDEQYLTEAGFFQNLGAGADRAVSGVARGIQRAGQTVAGAAKRAGTAVAGAGKAAVGAAQRVGQTAVGAAQRAGSAVAGGVQRAGQTVAGAAQRTGAAVQRAVTPVAQAVKGTAQRAVAAGQSALGGAAKAVQGAGQAVAGAAQRAGQAVAGGVQRAGSAVAGAAQGAARKIGQEVEISRRVGAGLPPTAGSGSAVAKTAPKQGAGAVAGGLAGGAMNKPAAPATTRVDGSAAGKPATSGTTPIKPAGATPTPTQVTAARPGMVGSSPMVKATNTAAASPSSGTTPIKPAGAPPTPTQVTAKKPSLASGVAELQAMRKASQQRIMAQGGTPATPLVQSFDPFDVVMGHLIDEGYADTEEAALKIMANMSEDWRNSILEDVVK